MLDWASCVSKHQNKGLSFILLDGQPSQPKFSFIWSRQHHWNSPWLSHQSVHTFTVASLVRVHLFQSVGLGNLTHSHSSGQGGGLPRVRWNRYWGGWVVWSRGQESFFPHMHIQLIQHHFPNVQHLGCHKSADSTHVGPVLDFLVCFLSLFV